MMLVVALLCWLTWSLYAFMVVSLLVMLCRDFAAEIRKLAAPRVRIPAARAVRR